MKVRALSAGPKIRTIQNLCQDSGACRLDPGAIASAVPEVEPVSRGSADLFMLNKFDPDEVSGRGFVFAIGKALEAEIPVLVGVGPVNQAAFDSFADGLAEKLPDDLDSILQCCDSAILGGSGRVISPT